jgi:hypothetical protein
VAVDPETVTLHATYRVGFIAPTPNSLSPGELYIELVPPDTAEDNTPRVWVGTPDASGFPGNIASLVPLGVELPPPLPVTAPVNVDIPAVMPLQASPGDTLNCTMGNWQGEPDTYTYQWQSDGADTGANAGADYTIPPTDAGKTITCVVTATNPRGSTQAPPSNPVAIPAARAAPAAAAAAHDEPKPKRHKD